MISVSVMYTPCDTFTHPHCNKGVDVATVSGALGHSTITTTMSIYCHELNQAQAKASAAIASVLDFGESGQTACIKDK